MNLDSQLGCENQGGYMPGEHSEREEIRPAVPASIHGPVRLNTAKTLDTPDLEKEQAIQTTHTVPPEKSPLPRDSEPPAPRSPLYRRFAPRRSWLVPCGVALVVVALLLLIADVGHAGGAPDTAVRHPPTATTVPTATPSIVPTPTLRPGFQLFIDNTDGFLLEYPTGWTHRLSNPGAEFADDPVNATFEMQVLLPSDSAAAGLSGDPNNPASWVNFAMQSFANLYAGNFQQDAGPLPAATFAGSTWQTGRGLISDQVGQVSQARIRVQVYATIYQGKPYIISLYAADGTFNVADTIYFQPMRESFEFLPPAV
jgi:hypothetical protein